MVGGVVVGGMLSESREREGEAGPGYSTILLLVRVIFIRTGMHDITLRLVCGKTCFCEK